MHKISRLLWAFLFMVLVVGCGGGGGGSDGGDTAGKPANPTSASITTLAVFVSSN